jgi:hypothetical protein
MEKREKNLRTRGGSRISICRGLMRMPNFKLFPQQNLIFFHEQHKQESSTTQQHNFSLALPLVYRYTSTPTKLTIFDSLALSTTLLVLL